MSGHDNDDLIDYDDEHDIPTVGTTASGVAGDEGKDKKNFSGIHSTGFRYAIFFSLFLTTFSNLTRSDFLLKPELLRAISDLGFEHPSEGKHLF